jgi:hypothetical protein
MILTFTLIVLDLPASSKHTTAAPDAARRNANIVTGALSRDFSGQGFPVLLGMPKGLKRYYGQHHLHFITCSCYRRLPLLRSVRAKNLFTKVLEEVHERYGFALVGYVVMGGWPIFPFDFLDTERLNEAYHRNGQRAAVGAPCFGL